MFNTNPERSDKTKLFYLCRGGQNWKRVAREKQIPANMLMPSIFTKSMDSLFFTFRDATKRVYKASNTAYLDYMRVENLPHGGDSQDLDKAIEHTKKIQSCDYEIKIDPNSEAKKIKMPHKTSSGKEKSVDFVELFYIEDELERLYGKKSHHARKWTEDVLTFIYANIFAGLRPCEWRYARLGAVEIEVEGVVSLDLCLIIQNAKNSNGRSHGKERHLVLTGMDRHQLNSIKKQLAVVKKYRGSDKDWTKYYNALSKEFRKMTRHLLFRPGQFPTYPTLYSTRHQFVANAKYARFSDAEIAAMLGHATDLTASLHYSKIHMGRSGFCVKPIKSEVAKIKLVKGQKKSKAKQKPLTH